MTEIPKEKTLKENVEEFFRKPIITRRALEVLFTKDGLVDVLVDLIREDTLTRTYVKGKWFYTLNE